MGQTFYRTRDQMNNLRWDNTCAFGDQVDRSTPQATSAGQIKCTVECFSWPGSDDLRAKIERPCSRQYKPGDVLAVRQCNCDTTIDEDDDDGNCVDSGTLSSGLSSSPDDNDNGNGEGDEHTLGGGKGTGQGKERRIGRE
jgi:hypothetical protein